MKNKEAVVALGCSIYRRGRKEHHQEGVTRFKALRQRHTASKYQKGLEQVKEKTREGKVKVEVTAESKYKVWRKR